MATVTTRYVIYASRRRRRQGGNVIDIQPSGNSLLAAGDTYQVPPGFPIIPWTDSNGQVHDLQFAFWSVVGGTGGPVVSFPGEPSPTVTVGATNIIATAWYVDLSGGGDGGPGIIIDAFDENIGDFVLDDFVTVAPGDAALNTAANWDGFVPTNVAEAITAYSTIHGVPFDQWRIPIVLTPTVSAANMVVNAGVKSVAFAFAYYKTPDRQVGIYPFKEWAISTWVSWGVMVDGGGPTGDGPVGPWDPLMREFASGMALMQLATKVNSSLGKETMALAAKQIELAAEGISKKMKGFSFGKKGKG